ncbi:MAG: VWA domain-containing protein [Aeromicrobium sp.]|uniref:vWA domain-containing protein n=1 Tax=Aeromicrobium sp. TaxID=1871063 RepID=UPI0039E59E6B
MRRLLLAITLTAIVATTALPAHARESTETEAAPGRLMLVLDSSGSMAEPSGDGNARIEAAREALHTVIDHLPADQPVGMRVFGATVDPAVAGGTTESCTDSQNVVAVGTDNRDDLSDAVDAYEPLGETPIGYALQQAADDLGDDGQRTIVLVSDGEPNCDPDPCTVAEDLSDQGIDVRIDVVGLNVDQAARDKLSCIAKAGGGLYYDATDTQSLIDTLTTVQTRSTRPFDLTGTPVTGAEDPADAPTLTAPGQYLDTVASNEGAWYKVQRTVPGSTMHVGLTHKSDGIGNFGDKATAAVYAGPDENLCDSQSSFARGNIGYVSAMSYESDPENICNTVDTLWINVSEYSGELVGEPVEIVVYEEPPLADDAERDLAPQPDPPTWKTLEVGDPVTDVVPGSSISSAPVVEDGTYAFDINPGETQVVAVPLDWGQNLQAQFDGTVTQAHHDGDFAEPWVQVLGPLRQAVDTDEYGVDTKPEDWTDFPGRLLDDTTEFRTGSQSYTVGYLNRTVYEQHQRGSSIAGLRYVQVSYPDGNSAPMTYTLTLKTNGKAEDAPEYATSDLTVPTADSPLVGSAVTETDTEKTSADGQDSGTFPLLPVALGGAGVLALLGAGGVAVRSRRVNAGR